jgi:hypothetical protein
MSAAQPIKQVHDLGSLSSNNATRVVGDNFIVRSGIIHASASYGKNGGHVGVCNTTTSNVGVSSIHVNKGDDILFRFAHPCQSKIVGIETGSTTTLIVDTQDTKFTDRDCLTLVGSSVGIYNTTLRHVQINSVTYGQQWNDYQTKIVVAADTSSGHAAFTGVATAFKSVIPLMKAESSNGCDMFISEVQLG